MRLQRPSPSVAGKRAGLSRVLLLTVTGLLAGSVQVSSGRAADDPPAKPKTTTIVLFDGKGLDGWTRADFSSSGQVRVDNGALVLEEGNPMTGITTDRKDLPTTNYELTYEARRVSGHDFFAAATFPVGKSFITFVNGGWGGSVTGLSSLDGQDASENETTRGHDYKTGQWYRFRVRVTKDVVRCWIDDEQVVDVNYSDREVRTRIETVVNQPLGFATWETTGALRKVEVRTLTPAEIAATKKPIDD